MVIVQVICAVTLLAGAGELLESFRKLLHVDAGVRVDHLLTMRVALPESQYTKAEQVTAFFRSVIDRVKVIPGVESAATTNMLPIQSAGYNGDVEVVGLPPHSSSFFAEFRWISGDYFRTLGIPLARGRTFLPEEIEGRQRAIIISEKMARQLWGTKNPLGYQVIYGTPEPSTIVGVARDVHQSGLATASRAELYAPLATQFEAMGAQSLSVRSSLSMDELAPLVRREIRGVDPQAAIYLVESMQNVVDDSIRYQRITMTMLSLFAALALALAAFGLYGVMSYLVTERRHEFAVRLAIGAKPAALARMVFGQSFGVVGIGIVFGLGAAYGVSKTLPALLYGVRALEVQTLSIAVAVLMLAALAAVGVPAWRAVRIDPIHALRQE